MEHPEITMCLRTGYPSWMQDDDESDDDEYESDDGYDEDAAYEERRDAAFDDRYDDDY